MDIPAPKPAMVIRYAYLWADEHNSGREEGSKDRPAIIILAVSAGKQTEVLALPITHTPPSDPENALELPPATKARLGLDGERSWVVLSEVNRFAWPGPDLRPVSVQKDTCLYGFLPEGVFAAIRREFLKLRDRKRICVVPRTE
ncbi:MAG: plasmid maintenance toxin (PemK-like) [Rhodomicrobium sp.]